MSEINIVATQLLCDISKILIASRTSIAHKINTAMVQTYWHIGRLIVEYEQKGESRAEYGTQQLEFLSEKLQKDFGKGFDGRNLRNMRQFYLTYPIWNAVRTELSWTHYRTLLRIDSVQARNWYVMECIANNWSSRALERQINNLYYERLLSSSDKTSVEGPVVRFSPFAAI